MYLALQNAETINRLVEQGKLLLKTFYVQDAARPAGSCDTDGATSVCVRAAKRKFRIVKRENNIPVLGVCEYCNAEFSADPETIGRPKDAHAHIQKQFISHKCKRPDAKQNCGWYGS
jgi:hypothetical protein